MENKTFILNREIKAFVNNSIDSYRTSISTNFINAIRIFLNARGFILFVDENSNFKGYLDMVDLEQINKIAEGEDSKKSIEILINENKLKLRNKILHSTDKISKAINFFDENNQLYFPVYNPLGNLLGRTSLSIIKKRVKELYGVEVV